MKHILTAFLFAATFQVTAQTVTLDITWRDTTVIGADMTYAQAKTRWPAWVGYMEYIGASSKVLNIRKAVASHNNAVWANDDGPGVTNYANGCGSRVNIRWPYGVFRVDAELIQPQGIVWGEGSQGFQLDSWNVKSGGTTLIYDHAGWDGDPSKRYLIKDMTWGRVDNFGYTEGAQLHGFKIMGGGTGLNDPSYHFSAIGAWKRGEVSTIDNVFIYNANTHGVELGGQFHATFHSDKVSIFKSGVGAYGIYGGAHMQVFMGSYDDNHNVFYVRPDAAGSIGNGTAIKAYGIKFETGKTDGRPYSTGQQLADIENSWVMMDVYGFYYSKVNSMPHSLIRYKGKSGMRSTINLFGVTWFDKPAYMLHDRDKGTLYEMDQTGFSSAVTTWCWNSVDGVVLSPGVSLRPVAATCDQRLAPLPRDPMTGGAIGSWSGCTPLYSYTTPIASEGGPTTPPPTGTPCTYTTGPWSACTNGTQTRTVTATPSGCTGTPPPSSQPCTVTPPPVLTIKWASTFSGTNGCALVATTGANITQATSWACGAITGGKITTNRCTSFPLALAATRVVLVGVTFNSWEEWGWLNSAIRTRANGDLQDGTGKVLATVVKGAKVDRLTLDLSPGTTLQSVIGPADRNTCGTALFTCEAIEVY
jgi:hypothetical protein